MEPQKTIIDLFDTTESDKIKQKLQKELFESKPINNEKPAFDPMALGLKLMSKPKLIRNVLVVVGTLAAIGLGFSIYYLIVYTVLMVKNYYMTQIPLYQVVIICSLLKYYKKLGSITIGIYKKIKIAIINLKQNIKTKIDNNKTEVKPQTTNHGNDTGTI